MADIDIEKMFDEISYDYDFLNNLISLFTHKIVKRLAVNSLFIPENSKVLDLCSGTGDMGALIMKREKTASVIGVDISEKMIEKAAFKNKNIKYIKKDASDLPFCDNEFDIIVCAFGFRNIENKKGAQLEINRVLKKEGLFLHLDFGRSYLGWFYDRFVLFLAKIFSKKYYAYKYLIKSKNKFLSPDNPFETLCEKGFKVILKRNLLFGIISYQVFQKSGENQD